MFPKLTSIGTSECGLLCGCNEGENGIRMESNHWRPYGRQSHKDTGRPREDGVNRPQRRETWSHWELEESGSSSPGGS